MNTFTLKVIEVRKETNDAVTLCFKQPGLKKIKYLPGQYITLIIRINGRRYIRPYSFSSCPGIDQFLEITVKRVSNGIVSNHINDLIKEGDVIEFMQPMGDFVLSELEKPSSVYFWGTGSGITPLMSIIKHVLYTIPDLKVYLFYGNRKFENTIFAEKIDALYDEFRERFFVKYFYTQVKVDEVLPHVIQGRIDFDKIMPFLKQNDKIQTSSHFICGPIGLKESVRSALSIVNVNKSNIFFEEFELIKDPKDFEDIVTRNIVLDFNNNDTELEIVKGKSILEAALDADIELPYSCQTGTCNTCKAKLISGEAKMIGLSEVREDLLEDEYLLCCTHPLSDNIHIKI